MDKFCQNCHQPNQPDALFCRHCASPLPLNAGGGQQQANAGQYANQQWNQPNQAAGNFAAQSNYAPPSAKASGRALAALILAVCGLLCLGPLTGIPAAILGWMEVSAIKEGRSSPQGMTMAQIGLWGGIIISVLGVIGGLIFMLSLVISGGGY